MSDINPDLNNPADSGEHQAEIYVDRELIRNRKNLTYMRIGTSVVVVGLAIYLGYITSGFQQNLQPRTAATITTSLMNQRMDDLEPQFASFIREKVPETIRKAPDYALEHLPEYRASLEDRVESDIRGYASQNAESLSKTLNEFLTSHKDEVNAILENPDTDGTANQLGDELESQFRTFLAAQKVGDESIQTKLDSTLQALDETEKRTGKLAMNKGLTPSEKKARQAIAMLMRRIKSSTKDGSLPSIDPAAVKEAVAQVTESGTAAPTLP